MTWIASEHDAFILNPALNSVYGKTLAPTEFGTGPEKIAGYQGAVVSMLDVELGLDHFAECTISAENIGLLPPNNHTIGPAARMSIDPLTGKFSCYALEFSYDAGHFQFIWESDVLPGRYFSIATDAVVRGNLAPARFDIFAQVGDVLRIEAVGNQITGKRNGVIIFGPITDARLNGVRAGLEGYPENSNAASALQVSRFRCGSLPSGPIQAPSFDGIGSFYSKTPIEEVLRTRLLLDADVQTMVADRIIPDVAPNKIVKPCAIYQRLNHQENYDIEGNPYMQFPRIQYTCLADNWKQARQLLDVIRLAALKIRGTFDGVSIDSIFVADERDQGVDDIARAYRWDLDLEVYRNQL